MKVQKSERETKVTHYGAGTAVAIGALGVIGYYVYQSKTLLTNPKKLQFTDPRKLQINLTWIRL